MRSLRRRTQVLALSGTLAVTLVACGGGQSDQTAAPATNTAPASEAAGQTEAMPSPGSSETTASADPFADLKAAAQVVGNNGSAKALATGIVAATGMDGSVDSPAAQTYATLSTLLQEHVYLAGIAIDTGYAFGLDSPQFTAAADTLDKNSVELADVVGSVAPDKRDAFLKLWRQHIGFFVDYAKAAKADDDTGRQSALDELDGYRTQAGQFFADISGGAIPADAVESNLAKHVQSLTAAIDAAAAGTNTVFGALKDAAAVVGEQGSAKALATGIVTATGMDGSVDSSAAQTYATLSTLLEEHVYLAGIAVKTAYTAGADSDAFKAAAATLDENSTELADVVGSVAPDKRDAFLKLWRTHIGFFVDYAKAAAAGDQAAKQQALDDLDGYRTQAGQFFAGISGGAIPADAVESNLAKHVDTLTTAIDSLASTLVS